MFKKGVTVQTTQLLSGKDSKSLRRSLQVQYDMDEDTLAKLLPAKAELALLKLSNRSTAYTANAGSPLFFDPSGRGDVLVPTVYALWLCPGLLSAVFTYSEVSAKACMRLTRRSVLPSGRCRAVDTACQQTAVLCCRCWEAPTCSCRAG